MVKSILLTGLIAVLAGVAYAAGPDAATSRPVNSIPSKADRWNHLQKTCLQDFNIYQNEMKLYRTVINSEINEMSKDEYHKLDNAFDANIIFLAMNWPNDLSEKDEFWSGNQNCANLHYQLLRKLSSASSSRVEKAKAVELFRACMKDRFDRKKVIAPFDQLLSCYDERAKKD